VTDHPNTILLIIFVDIVGQIGGQMEMKKRLKESSDG
jgi:hypothetical protein